MKILFISNYSMLYGANRSLLSLITYFNEKDDYDIHVLLPSRGPIEKELMNNNVTYTVIWLYTQIFYYKYRLKYLVTPILVIIDLLKFPYLLYKISKINPDLIYSNTSAENLGVLVAKILRKKHISHIREFMDMDHKAYFACGRKMKKKYINMSDGVIYVSKAVAHAVKMSDVIPQNHVVVYNGVNFNKEKFEYKQIPMCLHFGIVGILDPAKGQLESVNYFNDLLNKYPNSILDIYGDKDGKYKQKLIQTVKDLNLTEKVIFHGFVSDANLIYKDIDILFMCSKSEGFGRVTVEAMSRGIPVLGYNNAGTSEIIKSGINGFLFNDINGIHYSLKLLLSSYEKYNYIRKNAYEDARKLFSEHQYCETVNNFIKQYKSNNKNIMLLETEINK